MLHFHRAQVLAYRYAVQGLDRRAREPSELAVLDLGVQDSPAGGARQSLRARLETVEPLDQRFTLAWTLRGAPHLHRLADLPRLASELRPISDADVLARMPGMATRSAEEPPLVSFDRAIRSMREHSRAPTDKSALSTAVSGDLPELSTWCRSCGATHIFYSVFLHSALPAGIRLDRVGTRVRILPLTPWQRPKRSDIASLIHRSLHLLGPASISDTAAFLGTSRAALLDAWPNDLVEVTVEGKRAWVPEADLPRLKDSPAPKGVRLLPTSDPYLQHRDRALTVPDPIQRKAIWRALGSPGALLVDGEVAGFWRTAKTGKTLRITLTSFGDLPVKLREAVEAEAQGIAEERGVAAVTMAFDSA